MSFFASIHCRSRAHCRACRGDRTWRQRTAARHGLEADFACPFGQDGAGGAPAEDSRLAAARQLVGRVAHGALSLAKTTLGRDRAAAALVEARLAVCRHCPGGHAVRHPDGAVQSCGPLLAAAPSGARAPCGCWLRQKARDARERCPFGWWPAPPAAPVG